VTEDPVSEEHAVPDAQQNGGPTGSGVNSSAAAADAINGDESGESHDGPLDVARRITGRSALAKAEESGYRAYPRLSAEFGAGV
jgi:hypothetical protein